MMDEANCEGCVDRYNRFAKKNQVMCRPVDTNEICPCSICIVKMMCETACNAFRTYRKLGD